MIITRKIGSNEVVWFKNSNSYFVLSPMVKDLLLLIEQKKSHTELNHYLKQYTTISIQNIKKIISDSYKLYHNQHKIIVAKKKALQCIIPKKNTSIKTYSFNSTTFTLHFETEYIKSLIHPLFAHLEIFKLKTSTFQYHFFTQQEQLCFLRNNELIGHWALKNVHIFLGKLSMQIIMDYTKKAENEWMSVLHASAISNNKNALLLLGESGNGKSTALSLLLAHGFNALADDFVPIDTDKNIHSFPAAISIKSEAKPSLTPYFPELKILVEQAITTSKKRVTYLPISQQNFQKKAYCKALVFIKYDKNSKLEIEKISSLSAFQKTVPDAWISSIKENVESFLDWFLNMRCYQLTYSNNNKMIETIHKIFNDDI